MHTVFEESPHRRNPEPRPSVAGPAACRRGTEIARFGFSSPAGQHLQVLAKRAVLGRVAGDVAPHPTGPALNRSRSTRVYAAACQVVLVGITVAREQAWTLRDVAWKKALASRG